MAEVYKYVVTDAQSLRREISSSLKPLETTLPQGTTLHDPEENAIGKCSSRASCNWAV